MTERTRLARYGALISLTFILGGCLSEARTPLLFVSSSDNYKDRYRGMRAGADDFLSKHTPIRELLLRVQVLLTRYSDLTISREEDQTGTARGMEGEIGVLGAPAVIQMCNQGMLTGILTADKAGPGASRSAAVFGFRDGQIISASCGDQTGPEAVYDLLLLHQFRDHRPPEER